MDFQIYNYTKYKFRVIEGRLSGKLGRCIILLYGTFKFIIIYGPTISFVWSDLFLHK